MIAAKKLTSASVAGFCLVLIVCLAAGLAASEVYVAEPEMDFGTVPPNATLLYRSWMYNYGADTVRLTDIKTGCGCLSADTSAATLLPGDSLLLTLFWQTRALRAPTTRTAYLYVDKLPDPLRIDLTGRPRTVADSASGVMAWFPKVNFQPQAAPRLSDRLRNLTSEELEVRMLYAPSDRVQVAFPDKLPANGEGVIVISVDSQEPFEDSFTLEFSGQDGYNYRLSIPVVNGNFSFRPVFSTTDL